MRILANILWHFPLFGFLIAGMTFIAGALLVALVFTAPIGNGLIQLSKFFLAPFSSEMIDQKELNIEENEAWKKYKQIVQIVYCLTLGWMFSLLIIFYIVGLAIGGLIFTITIILSPIGVMYFALAVVLAKTIPTVFNPVNKKCVPKLFSDELKKEKAKREVQKHLDS